MSILLPVPEVWGVKNAIFALYFTFPSYLRSIISDCGIRNLIKFHRLTRLCKPYNCSLQHFSMEARSMELQPAEVDHISSFRKNVKTVCFAIAKLGYVFDRKALLTVLCVYCKALSFMSTVCEKNDNCAW